MVTGSIAALSMKGILRNTRDSNGMPIFKSNMQDASRYELDGSPIYFPTDNSIPAATELNDCRTMGPTGLLNSPGHHLQSVGSGSNSRTEPETLFTT